MKIPFKPMMNVFPRICDVIYVENVREIDLPETDGNLTHSTEDREQDGQKSSSKQGQQKGESFKLPPRQQQRSKKAPVEKFRGSKNRHSSQGRLTTPTRISQQNGVNFNQRFTHQSSDSESQSYESSLDTSILQGNQNTPIQIKSLSYQSTVKKEPNYTPQEQLRHQNSRLNYPSYNQAQRQTRIDYTASFQKQSSPKVADREYQPDSFTLDAQTGIKLLTGKGKFPENRVNPSQKFYGGLNSDSETSVFSTQGYGTRQNRAPVHLNSSNLGRIGFVSDQHQKPHFSKIDKEDGKVIILDSSSSQRQLRPQIPEHDKDTSQWSFRSQQTKNTVSNNPRRDLCDTLRFKIQHINRIVRIPTALKSVLNSSCCLHQEFEEVGKIHTKNIIEKPNRQKTCKQLEVVRNLPSKPMQLSIGNYTQEHGLIIENFDTKLIGEKIKMPILKGKTESDSSDYVNPRSRYSALDTEINAPRKQITADTPESLEENNYFQQVSKNSVKNPIVAQVGKKQDEVQISDQQSSSKSDIQRALQYPAEKDNKLEQFPSNQLASMFKRSSTHLERSEQADFEGKISSPEKQKTHKALKQDFGESSSLNSSQENKMDAIYPASLTEIHKKGKVGMVIKPSQSFEIQMNHQQPKNISMTQRLLDMKPEMKIKAMEGIGIDSDLDSSQMVAAFDQMVKTNILPDNPFVSLNFDWLQNVLEQDDKLKSPIKKPLEITTSSMTGSNRKSSSKSKVQKIESSHENGSQKISQTSQISQADLKRLKDDFLDTVEHLFKQKKPVNAMAIKDYLKGKLQDPSRKQDVEVLETQLQKCCFELGISSTQKLSKDAARALSRKMRANLNDLKSVSNCSNVDFNTEQISEICSRKEKNSELLIPIDQSSIDKTEGDSSSSFYVSKSKDLSLSGTIVAGNQNHILDASLDKGDKSFQKKREVKEKDPKWHKKSFKKNPTDHPEKTATDSESEIPQKSSRIKEAVLQKKLDKSLSNDNRSQAISQSNHNDCDPMLDMMLVLQKIMKKVKAAKKLDLSPQEEAKLLEHLQALVSNNNSQLGNGQDAAEMIDALNLQDTEVIQLSKKDKEFLKDVIYNSKKYLNRQKAKKEQQQDASDNSHARDCMNPATSDAKFDLQTNPRQPQKTTQHTAQEKKESQTLSATSSLHISRQSQESVIPQSIQNQLSTESQLKHTSGNDQISGSQIKQEKNTLLESLLDKLDPSLKVLIGPQFLEEIAITDFMQPYNKKKVLKNLLHILKAKKQKKQSDTFGASESDELEISATSSEVGNISRFLNTIYEDKDLQKELKLQFSQNPITHGVKRNSKDSVQKNVDLSSKNEQLKISGIEDEFNQVPLGGITKTAEILIELQHLGMDEEEFELIVSEMPNTNDKTKLLKKLLTAVKEKKRKQIIHELSLDPEQSYKSSDLDLTINSQELSTAKKCVDLMMKNASNLQILENYQLARSSDNSMVQLEAQQEPELSEKSKKLSKTSLSSSSVFLLASFSSESKTSNNQGDQDQNSYPLPRNGERPAKANSLTNQDAPVNLELANKKVKKSGLTKIPSIVESEKLVYADCMAKVSLVNLDPNDSTDMIIIKKKLQKQLRKAKLKKTLGISSSQLNDSSEIDMTIGSQEQLMIQEHLETLKHVQAEKFQNSNVHSLAWVLPDTQNEKVDTLDVKSVLKNCLGVYSTELLDELARTVELDPSKIRRLETFSEEELDQLKGQLLDKILQAKSNVSMPKLQNDLDDGSLGYDKKFEPTVSKDDLKVVEMILKSAQRQTEQQDLQHNRVSKVTEQILQQLGFSEEDELLREKVGHEITEILKDSLIHELCPTRNEFCEEDLYQEVISKVFEQPDLKEFFSSQGPSEKEQKIQALLQEFVTEETSFIRQEQENHLQFSQPELELLAQNEQEKEMLKFFDQKSLLKQAVENCKNQNLGKKSRDFQDGLLSSILEQIKRAKKLHNIQSLGLDISLDQSMISGDIEGIELTLEEEELAKKMAEHLNRKMDVLVAIRQEDELNVKQYNAQELVGPSKQEENFLSFLRKEKPEIFEDSFNPSGGELLMSDSELLGFVEKFNKIELKLGASLIDNEAARSIFSNFFEGVQGKKRLTTNSAHSISEDKNQDEQSFSGSFKNGVKKAIFTNEQSPIEFKNQPNLKQEQKPKNSLNPDLEMCDIQTANEAINHPSTSKEEFSEGRNRGQKEQWISDQGAEEKDGEQLSKESRKGNEIDPSLLNSFKDFASIQKKFSSFKIAQDSELPNQPISQNTPDQKNNSPDPSSKDGIQNIRQHLNTGSFSADDEDLEESVFQQIVAEMRQAKKAKMEKVLGCQIHDDDVSMTSDDLNLARRASKQAKEDRLNKFTVPSADQKTPLEQNYLNQEKSQFGDDNYLASDDKNDEEIRCGKSEKMKSDTGQSGEKKAVVFSQLDKDIILQQHEKERSAFQAESSRDIEVRLDHSQPQLFDDEIQHHLNGSENVQDDATTSEISNDANGGSLTKSPDSISGQGQEKSQSVSSKKISLKQEEEILGHKIKTPPASEFWSQVKPRSENTSPKQNEIKDKKLGLDQTGSSGSIKKIQNFLQDSDQRLEIIRPGSQNILNSGVEIQQISEAIIQSREEEVNNLLLNSNPSQFDLTTENGKKLAMDELAQRLRIMKKKSKLNSRKNCNVPLNPTEDHAKKIIGKNGSPLELDQSQVSQKSSELSSLSFEEIQEINYFLDKAELDQMRQKLGYEKQGLPQVHHPTHQYGNKSSILEHDLEDDEMLKKFKSTKKVVGPQQQQEERSKSSSQEKQVQELSRVQPCYEETLENNLVLSNHSQTSKKNQPVQIQVEKQHEENTNSRPSVTLDQPLKPIKSYKSLINHLQNHSASKASLKEEKSSFQSEHDHKSDYTSSLTESSSSQCGANSLCRSFKSKKMSEDCEFSRFLNGDTQGIKHSTEDQDALTILKQDHLSNLQSEQQIKDPDCSPKNQDMGRNMDLISPEKMVLTQTAFDLDEKMCTMLEQDDIQHHTISPSKFDLDTEVKFEGQQPQLLTGSEITLNPQGQKVPKISPSFESEQYTLGEGRFVKIKEIDLNDIDELDANQICSKPTSSKGHVNFLHYGEGAFIEEFKIGPNSQNQISHNNQQQITPGTNLHGGQACEIGIKNFDSDPRMPIDEDKHGHISGYLNPPARIAKDHEKGSESSSQIEQVYSSDQQQTPENLKVSQQHSDSHDPVLTDDLSQKFSKNSPNPSRTKVQERSRNSHKPNQNDGSEQRKKFERGLTIGDLLPVITSNDNKIGKAKEHQDSAPDLKKLNFSDSDPVLDKDLKLQKLAQAQLDSHTVVLAELAPDAKGAFRQGYFIGFKDGFQAARSNIWGRENPQNFSKPIFTFQNSPNVLSNAGEIICQSLRGSSRDIIEDGAPEKTPSQALKPGAIKLTQLVKDVPNNQRKISANCNKSMNMGKPNSLALIESRAQSLDLDEERKCKLQTNSRNKDDFENLSHSSDCNPFLGKICLPFNLHQVQSIYERDKQRFSDSPKTPTLAPVLLPSSVLPMIVDENEQRVVEQRLLAKLGTAAQRKLNRMQSKLQPGNIPFDGNQSKAPLQIDNRTLDFDKNMMYPDEPLHNREKQPDDVQRNPNSSTEDIQLQSLCSFAKGEVKMKNIPLAETQRSSIPFEIIPRLSTPTPQPQVPKIPVKFNDVNWSKINSSMTHIRDDVSNLTERNKLENLKLGREIATTKDRAKSTISCNHLTTTRCKSPANSHLAALTQILIADNTAKSNQLASRRTTLSKFPQMSSDVKSQFQKACHKFKKFLNFNFKDLNLLFQYFLAL